MASTMASTLALSRPSEKFGTHSTSVDITEEDSCAVRNHARLTQNTQKYLAASEKFSDPQPYLNSVNPGVRRGETSVRDVHVAQFEAHIVLCAENVHAE